jgi:hypothetical protein
MVMTFVIMILLVQLWLLTVAVEVMNGNASTNVAIAALICSLLACSAVWALIRLFLRAERQFLEPFEGKPIVASFRHGTYTHLIAPGEANSPSQRQQHTWLTTFHKQSAIANRQYVTKIRNILRRRAKHG